MTVVPHPPYFSLFPRMKIKLKSLHFDTMEVIEAESQAVLNTLTENDFQDAFKNGRKYKERFIRACGNCFEGDDMASRTKVSF
jgi:hypothetical protein